MATSKVKLRQELLNAINSHSRKDEPEYQKYRNAINTYKIADLPKKKGVFPFESAQRKRMREAHQRYARAHIINTRARRSAASAPTAEEKAAAAATAEEERKKFNNMIKNAQHDTSLFQQRHQQQVAKRHNDPAKKEALQEARKAQENYNKIQNGYIGSLSRVQTEGGKRKTKYSHNNKKHRSKLHTKKGKKRQTYRKTKNKKRNKKKYTTYRR